MNKDFTKELVFYKAESYPGNYIKQGRSYVLFTGRKAEQDRYYYPLISMNTFSTQPVPIPPEAVKERKPSLSWIRRFMYDPKKIPAVKQDLPQHKDDVVFPIHDNGSVPFLVYISKDQHTVSVYRKPRNSYLHSSDWSSDFKDNIGYYTELLAQYNPISILIGEDRNTQQHGNSILLKISPRKYVYIGHCIYSFVTSDDITRYFSDIGNSDVPYPVAISQQNAYFMLDRVVLPRNKFPELKTDESFSNAYKNFYFVLPKNTIRPKFRNIKIIQKRL